MVVPSLQNAKPSSLASLKGIGFYPCSNGEVVLGFEQASPVLFMAIKSGGNGNDLIGSLRLEASFHLF